ncbi:MAG TPA: DNA polymerase III subunit delta' [Casimicrobiaceae bacterium]|nr:DNA polymerase III subunit delta' [Casimicrobiaceae bacterium]
MTGASAIDAAGDDAVPDGRQARPLPWQRRFVADMLARRAGWPHALLVTGPAGIGKRRLAEVLAFALLCESPQVDGSACGGCPGCRYAAAGQHPDFRIVEPVEVDDEGVAKRVEAIVVDRIRALTEWVQVTSHRGGSKVALIVPAERMNAAAANALLKTLEEPPAETFLILVSHQPGRLPATISSRCQRVDAPRPSAAESAEWLAAEGVGEPERVLAQAAYAPLAAIGLAGAEYQAERRSWLTAFAQPAALSVAALGARIDALPRESRKEGLGAVIGWLSGWCTDLARVRFGGAPLQNGDMAAELAALAGSVAPVALFRYHRALLRARALLGHPLQPRLVAEALLIDYRELFGR